VQKILEQAKIEQRKKSISNKDVKSNIKYNNVFKRLANKNKPVQKVEVFLSSQENNDFINGKQGV
jgi:hypothetical protein